MAVIASLGLPAASDIAAGQGVILENAAARLGIDAGRITALVDKKRGVDHVDPAALPDHGLFRIMLVRGTTPVAELDSTEMRVRVASRSDSSVELEFEHASARARVLATLEASGQIAWSISVRPSDREHAVARVAFPVVSTPRRVEGQEKQYLFPMFEGRYLPLSQPPYWRSYPSHLFAQFIACISAGGGLLLWTDDPSGHVKQFGYENHGTQAAFAVRHLMPYQPGTAWEPTYRTWLTPCGPSWYDAADLYRVWASRQSWSRTPLRDRTDVPPILHEPALCISSQLTREDLATLPDRLAEWGTRFQAPIIYRPLGWEQHGNWVGIDYLPPSIGTDRFRALAAQLKERSISLSLFVSGLRWTTHDANGSPQTNALLASLFDDRKGSRWCERARDQTLLSATSEGRDSHRICRGTPLGRELIPGLAAQLFELGATAIHDDQDHGPYPDGNESCFDASHGHPIPCGPWSTDATRRFLQETRNVALEHDVSDFFLTKESCTELLNMDLQAYQARFFHEATHPGVVPLAQYLYHEQVPVMFGWVTAQDRSIWQLAAMLIYGQVPSLAFWNSPAGTPGEIPEPARLLLEDYYAGMRSYARPLLLHGRMSRPLAAGGPVFTRTIAPPPGRGQRPAQQLTVPFVIQSAWDEPGGSVGVFAVNTHDQPISLQLTAPHPDAWRVQFHQGGTSQQTHTGRGRVNLTWELPTGRLCAAIFTPHNAESSQKGLEP